MRIAIVQFPGSNCERETCLAVQRAGMTPVEYLWNEPSEKLTSCDGYILVGGFSYEDRSRAGIIAACDPILQVIKEQSEKRKPVLGICNGAQILVEAGMVPAFERYQLQIALTDNKRVQRGKVLGTGFYNAWVNIKTPIKVKKNAFTRFISHHAVLNIPIAHGEGRFIIPDDVLARIKEQGLIVFQYCTSKGFVLDEFPVNPNSSVENIAAICNSSGNVMAMMPHPERTSEGDTIFLSMRDYIHEH